MTTIDLTHLRPGLSGTATLVVADEHTAKSVGSGSLEVFATPVMIALMEAAAVACLQTLLPEGTTSLGTHVDVSHDRATALGVRVTATAIIETVDERSVSFRVEATDESGPAGRGTHRRAVVGVERFLARLARTTVAS